MVAINKLEHNWLIKKINNESVAAHRDQMTGEVYDLGCGVQPHATEIRKVCDRYIGVDWSNTLHGLRADIVADLNKPLPIRDSVADNVVSFQVLEHLCEPQVLVNEAFRILRPAGKIFLAVPFQWWLHEAPWDYFRYTRHGLAHLLTKAGFIDATVTAVTGFWSMWFLKLNYQSTRLLRGPAPVRAVLRGALIPFWWLNQTVAPRLDARWPSEEETAGYFAVAKKQ